VAPVVHVTIEPASEQKELALAALLRETPVEIADQAAFLVLAALPERRAETVALAGRPCFDTRVDFTRHALDFGRRHPVRIHPLIRFMEAERGDPSSRVAQAQKFGADSLQQLIHVETVSAGRAVTIFTRVIRLRSISWTMNVREP